MHPIRVLVAPCGFKESLGPEEVAKCIEAGVKRAAGDLPMLIRKVPVHDGGEGFCQSFVSAHGGTLHRLEVTGPTRIPITAHYGTIDKPGEPMTAVLDMASAAGLRLVPKDHRNPTLTTTYGVGELMSAALDKGCRRIIIGCGDSGTSDGGAGMLQALGARFLDADGNELPRAAGGGSLIDLETISLDNIHPKLRSEEPVSIEAVCNIENILCGERGVARVYGPQKGATKPQIETLSSALDALAQAAKPILGKDISNEPGAGASGGLGAGLLLLKAKLRPRVAAIDDYFHLQDEFAYNSWDVVFTAEGSLDWQSAKGKMTVEIAKRARDSGCYQVVALAGTIRDGAESVYAEGIAAFTSIIDSPLSLEDAIKQTPTLLTNSAERTMRMLLVGRAMSPLQSDNDATPSGSASPASASSTSLPRSVPQIPSQPATLEMDLQPLAV